MKRLHSLPIVAAALSLYSCQPPVDIAVQGSIERVSFHFSSPGLLFGRSAYYVDEIIVLRGAPLDDGADAVVWHVRSDRSGRGTANAVYGKSPTGFATVVEPQIVEGDILYTVRADHGQESFLVVGPNSIVGDNIQIVGNRN